MEEKPIDQQKKTDKPKRTYQLSTAERARRAAQKRLRAAKKKATASTKKAEAQRDYARKLEKTIGKVEKGIKGDGSTVVDMGDLSVLPESVSELVQDSEVVFQELETPQEEADFLKGYLAYIRK